MVSGMLRKRVLLGRWFACRKSLIGFACVNKKRQKRAIVLFLKYGVKSTAYSTEGMNVIFFKSHDKFLRSHGFSGNKTNWG